MVSEELLSYLEDCRALALQEVQRIIPPERRLLDSLVAEGRRVAATPEGRAWATALTRSPLIRHASELWGARSPNLAAAGEPSHSTGGPRHGTP